MMFKLNIRAILWNVDHGNSLVKDPLAIDILNWLAENISPAPKQDSWASELQLPIVANGWTIYRTAYEHKGRPPGIYLIIENPNLALQFKLTGFSDES